jgi:hypothetical protein
MKIFILAVSAAVGQLSERTDFSAASPAETINEAITKLRPAVGAEIFIVLSDNHITATAVILPEKLLQVFKITSCCL